MTRIAMWSGPRNISTAMMRSFGSRPDTAVTDEPLYAHYLKVTGVAHPGREDVLAAHESDWRKVADQLTGPVPGGRAIWYQKHMAHHLLPMIERAWLDRLTHAFLIREPDEMVASLLKTFPAPASRTPGCRSNARYSIASQAGMAARRPSCSRATYSRIRERSWKRSATRSEFSSCRRCSPGRLDRATRTAPGPRTGTRRSRRRPASSRTGDGRSISTAAQERLVDECRPWYEKLYALRLRA